MREITVIIPVYNCKNYLRQAVQSVISQPYQALKVLLVDDGSTDGSAVLCDKLADQDKRITVIHQKNCGVSAARNIGLNIASGEYIGFVDADDIVSNCMFEMLYTQAIRLNADICMCSYKKIKTIEEAETLDGYINNIDVIPMNQKDTIEAIIADVAL